MNYKVYKVRVWEDGKKFWFNENDRLHNEHGPAVEYADGSKYYLLNGKDYSYNDWKREVEKLNKSEVKELTLNEVSKLLGFNVKIVKG